MSVPLIKNFDAPPVDLEEILRYLGQKERNAQIEGLIRESLEEVSEHLSYKACYLSTNCQVGDGVVKIGESEICSSDLAKNLRGAKEVILFACSIGFAIDRFIEKYKVIAPTKSLVMHAVGVERVESLANEFCFFMMKELKKENKSLKPRFSAGYGDFGIENQKLFFDTLDISKLLGITLNESMLMSPSKSVTAIIGITKEKEPDCHGCDTCNAKCEYRR